VKLNKPWTDKDDSRLKAMAAGGASAIRAAAALHRTLKSIKVRARMLGTSFSSVVSKRRSRPETSSNLWYRPRFQSLFDRDDYSIVTIRGQRHFLPARYLFLNRNHSIPPVLTERFLPGNRKTLAFALLSPASAEAASQEASMGLAQYSIVAVRDQWSILHDGEVSKMEYLTKEAAFEAAAAAASLAIRQGHEVHVSVPGREAGEAALTSKAS
jgi:hypothetical protein